MPFQSKSLSNLTAKKFHDDLKSLLRRFNPKKYSIFIADRLAESTDDTNKMRQWPPHLMLHSMEGNCAWYRKVYEKPISPKDILKVIGIYHDFYDPYFKYKIEEEKNLYLILRGLAHQQFDAQESYHANDIARCLSLFVYTNAMRQTEDEFKERYNLTTRDWVGICLLAPSIAADRRPPIIELKDFLRLGIQTIPKDSFVSFLTLASKTLHEIGQAFISQRGVVEPLFRMQIKSLFIESPLLDFGTGDFLVVHSPFILRLSWEGIYRLSRDFDCYPNEFAKSFEAYVRGILPDIPNVMKILSEVEIKRLFQGRVCDFVIELPDCVLLIECKAVSYVSRLVTQNAMVCDNSTKKIYESFDQIRQTAVGIRGGVLDGQLSVLQKPLIAITVTFGEIPLVNAPWYYENIMLERLSRDDAGRDIKRLKELTPPLEFWPQVLSISTLERFIYTMRQENISPLELIRLKLAKDTQEVGDWPEYFTTTYRVNKLPILQSQISAIERFIVELFGKQLWERIKGKFLD